MRTRFELAEYEPFHFDVEGVSYKFSGMLALAKKERPTTLVHEYVFKLPIGKYVYLTVVGDDDQYMKNGLERGWYVAELLSESDALWLVNALGPFTELSHR
jgi:hypothetical protein